MHKLFRSRVTRAMNNVGDFLKPTTSIAIRTKTTQSVPKAIVEPESLLAPSRNPLLKTAAAAPILDSLAAELLHESFPQISSSLQAAAAAAVVSPTIKIDFFETATEYHLEAELPGVEQDNISLSYDDETRVLTIKAAKETYFSNDQDTKNKAATGKGNGKKVKKATAIETPTAAAAAEPPAVNISALNELYQLETNALTKAEKKALRRQRKKAMKESGVSGNTLYHRVERSYGVSTRSMTMPEDAELENMRAWYKDGLLVISMPRNEGLSKSKEYLSHIKKVPIEA